MLHSSPPSVEGFFIEGSSFNWGQININFQSKRDIRIGGFLILEYQKSFSPLYGYLSLIDQINVDLTPIKTDTHCTPALTSLKGFEQTWISIFFGENLCGKLQLVLPYLPASHCL